MNTRLTVLKKEVQSLIDEKTLGVDRDDYREFLDWLISEGECRMMALAYEESDED